MEVRSIQPNNYYNSFAKKQNNVIPQKQYQYVKTEKQKEKDQQALRSLCVWGGLTLATIVAGTVYNMKHGQKFGQSLLHSLKGVWEIIRYEVLGIP